MRYDKVVGIGHSCVPAYQIRRWLSQPEAYFFDWLVVPPPALVTLIRGGLIKPLFERSKFAIHEPPKPTGKFVPVVQTDLKVIFYHDFGKIRGVADFDTVKKKYEFLEGRWNELINQRIRNGNKLLFIRHHIKKDECIEVQQILKATYPGLNFDILAVNECDPESLKWDVPGILSHYVKPSPVWYGDVNEWLRVFNAVGVR